MQYSQAPEPFNVKVMDVEQYIQVNQLNPVTSLSIYEPSSTTFNERGLFSEEIFGPVASEKRLYQLGYIELNCEIIAPVLFKNLMKLSSLYEEVFLGKTVVRFDPVLKNFVRYTQEDGAPVPDHVGTGFSYFLRYHPELEHAKSPSDERETRIQILDKYKDISIYRQYLVLPAGLRDLTPEEGRLVQDDVNSLYRQLLSYTMAIPKNSKSSLFDPVRVNIQLKAIEIYEYLENILTGKRGFIQGAYGRRRVAMGTRNVITASSYNTLTPDHPQAHQHNETKIGLFQTLRGLQPIVTHWVKNAFIRPVLGEGDTPEVALTDKISLKLKYVTLTAKELNRMTGVDAIENWSNKFANSHIRNQPISLETDTGESYYLCLIYDTYKEISIVRSIDDAKNMLGDKFNPKYLRPVTWGDVFYLCTANAAEGRHVFITRYPVTLDGSCYPSKIHLVTTSPGRVVYLRDLLSDTLTKQYPQYPIFSNFWDDAISPAADKLAGLGGD